ncbi:MULTISPECIES: helix-turn-helix domain-containing protein [Haloferax]|uniref:helix-turn-helix domain-containing protein n=1 Tax=Haloferax TaxID=2251 RepID=UPI001E3C2AFB|nr:helix-turn-helix domain-containing protein [Haloferax mediterranei]
MSYSRTANRSSSPRQSNGAYDNPRGCTLTELAEAFGINKSAASGIPHRAEVG